MTAVTITHGTGGELTVDDLDAMPDDGRRHELIDGTLVVTPAPVLRHQAVARELFRLLDPLSRVVDGLSLFFAPVDVRVSRTTSLQPDLLIVREAHLDWPSVPDAPVLVVEILSPSTRHVDLGLKRSAYAAIGAPSYWVVDPDEPSIIAWELSGADYVEAGRAAGEERLRLTRPFDVEIVPGALLH